MKRDVLAFDRGKVSGFTLLEVLIVLVIIAMATTLAALVVTGGLDGMRLRTASKEIAAQLRYTRTQAIATGKPQRFVIDPRSHRWQGPNNRNGEIPASIGVAFVGAREAQARAGEGGVLFFPDGASTGGRVELSAKRAVSRIDVTWLTGEVRLIRASASETP